MRNKKLRLASCLGKVTYRTREEALAAASGYRERVPIMETQLNVYQCKFGDHWHFGHNYRRTMIGTMVNEFKRDSA